MTFDELSGTVAKNSEMLSLLLEKIAQLEQKIDALGEKSESAETNNNLLFGIWNPNELIRMSDKRLWTGPSAPFSSYQAVARAKRAGCPFVSNKGQRNYRISAKDLYDYPNNTKLRERTLRKT